MHLVTPKPRYVAGHGKSHISAPLYLSILPLLPRIVHACIVVDTCAEISRLGVLIGGIANLLYIILVDSYIKLL